MPQAALPSISIVIPSYNAAKHLGRCLAALGQSTVKPLEVIVVDDGSSDESPAVAAAFNVTVLRSGMRRGPASARNLGWRAAAGDICLFLDADVCIERNAMLSLQTAFASCPDLDALIGAYDDAPEAAGFLSQYRNLTHCYVHGRDGQTAATFWTGCGAARRDVLQRLNGFDETYKRPAIEDIELGYRLIKSGHRIALDSTITGRHLKRWTLWEIFKTDFFDRGIPWTLLILRDGFMPDVLNLRRSQRVSVALVSLLTLLIGLAAVSPQIRFSAPVMGLIAALAVATVWINRSFYSFLAVRRGPLFAARAIPFHSLYFLNCALSFVAGSTLHLWRRSGAAGSAKRQSTAGTASAFSPSTSGAPASESSAAAEDPSW